jgi:ADP-ribosylglycohydrolase
MARDDDLDYTILALHLLETDGFGFGPADVGRHWLERFPVLKVYTAERAAYRNLVAGLAPPATATYRNPHREWIGAQIRADLLGYVSPGDPERAARLAHADASLSHTANGIYGEMWAAALIAASFTAPDMRVALDAALAAIPSSSRLAEALRFVDGLHARGLDADATRDAIRARYGTLSWIHTINNAALVAAALLWGEGDFTRTIALAVQGGWDTDCNGATAGSAFGAMHGRDALPAHWVEPLGDRIRSALAGYDGARISELARRTVALALRAGEPAAG